MDDIERAAFPDLLTAGGSPAYIAMRDAIVRLYRDVPQKRLCATDCLKHIPADAATVVRVHAFCYHWGLINHEAKGTTRFQKAQHMSRPEASAETCSVTGVQLDKACYICWMDPAVKLSPQVVFHPVSPTAPDACGASLERLECTSTINRWAEGLCPSGTFSSRSIHINRRPFAPSHHLSSRTNIIISSPGLNHSPASAGLRLRTLPAWPLGERLRAKGQRP